MLTAGLKTPYYVFYADQFIENYHELEDTFKAVYPYYRIAYSFKTNYTPAVCGIVKELGGYAEVVSDMEYQLARRLGFPDDRILYNGPGKGKMLEECLLSGGHLHIDNRLDLMRTISLAKRDRGQNFKVAVRVNFDIGNEIHSRFGFDLENGDFKKAVDMLDREPNISVNGIHFHISRARGLEAWKTRADKLLAVADSCFSYPLEYIDIGSGMFGDLEPELKEQFEDPPTYKDYADTVIRKIADHYRGAEQKPLLFTEPGTTLVSRYFHIFTTVLDIKQIRGKHYGLLDCSFHNVGEICGLKKVPLANRGGAQEKEYYEGIDLVGYTCLEQDVIYHGYQGQLGIGDVLEIRNVGGYSIVDKPPFIHPDIPIYMEKDGQTTCVKREQTADDVFAPYVFG